MQNRPLKVSGRFFGSEGGYLPVYLGCWLAGTRQVILGLPGLPGLLADACQPDWNYVGLRFGEFCFGVFGFQLLGLLHGQQVGEHDGANAGAQLAYQHRHDERGLEVRRERQVVAE